MLYFLTGTMKALCLGHPQEQLLSKKWNLLLTFSNRGLVFLTVAALLHARLSGGILGYHRRSPSSESFLTGFTSASLPSSSSSSSVGVVIVIVVVVGARTLVLRGAGGWGAGV